MRADIERWNAKYETRERTVVLEPDPLLLQHRGLLTGSGLGLDLAGGTGDNGLFLGSIGYDSVIVDGSETGLQLCRHKARANGLEPMLVTADLDRFHLPPDHFDVVLVFRYLNRKLISSIIDCLKAGGLLFFKTFNTRHLERHPGFQTEYLLEDGELSQWFKDWRCVDTNDGSPTDFTYHWVGCKPRITGPERRDAGPHGRRVR